MSSAAFDVVVVGAGAAGCVVASRLAESPSRSVLLLEAGPDLPTQVLADWRNGWRLPTVPDWGFESEPQGGVAASKLRRGRLLGGTSWLTRFAVRGAAADFDAWAAGGNPGWSFAEVLPAFRRVEADAEFGGSEFHGDVGPIPINRYPREVPSEIHAAALEAFSALGFPHVDDHNLPTAVGAGPMPMSTRDGLRVTSADGYLAPDRRPSNLTIRSDAPVATVIIDRGLAMGVRLVDGTPLFGGWVVLAAGTYGSPQILMRSGIGPAEHLREVGIDLQLDLPGVGSNLADHPGVDLDSGWRGTAKGDPILHSIATFRSSTAPPGVAPDLMFWVSDPEGDEPRFYVDPILLKPDSRGSVRLRSADPTATPRIRLPGVRAAHDVERLAEGYRTGLELADRPEIRRLAKEAPPSPPSTAEELRHRIVENAYSIPHVVGTCRMGPSPGGGDVVDAMGRVYGVDRLSVSDASVIPDAPSGFPHLVTLMLAEHLTEKLPDLLSVPG
jgi:choline dehydrogenase